MTDTHGPLDIIPLKNYPPIITYANYMAIKQMIDQVINEDQEYVNWKLKCYRTGGTMNHYLDKFKNEKDMNTSSHFITKDYLNLQNGNSFLNKQKEILSCASINEVPSHITFVREIYDQKINSLPRPRELSTQEVKRLFVNHLDEEQMNRYEVFKRTSLTKNQIKKISGIVTNQTVAANINLLLGGVGKIFVGEIVEKALDVKQKWLVGIMVNRFNQRKIIGNKLKKHLKKITLSLESMESIDDSVNEQESDEFDDDDREEINFMKNSNKLLKLKVDSEDIRQGIIKQYNFLVKKFNNLDVSVEKYTNSPLLPEHIHEAWRLYRLENETVPTCQWRLQGEENGLMFR